MKRKTKLLVCCISAVLALGILFYPLVSNYLGEKNRSLIETRYSEAVKKMDTAELDAARSAASAYNGTLLSITDKAFSKETLAKAAESYDELLNIRGDGIMGYVEIPTLNVELPIYHGTDESTLDRGLGHLLGSSLPVGGVGTHCVITGHSGLAGQRMFSDLDKLKKGDVFFLKILDETLAYMVLDINTVLPEDTSELAIDPNRDSCTLVTCTPYGVNTHRLLVRGERIEYETAVSIVEETPMEELPESTWTEEYLKGILGALAGIAVLSVAVLLLHKTQDSKKKARARKKQPRPRKERETAYIPKHSAAYIRQQKNELWWEPQSSKKGDGKHEKR